MNFLRFGVDFGSQYMGVASIEIKKFAQSLRLEFWGKVLVVGASGGFQILSGRFTVFAHFLWLWSVDYLKKNRFILRIGPRIFGI